MSFLTIPKLTQSIKCGPQLITLKVMKFWQIKVWDFAIGTKKRFYTDPFKVQP